MSTRECSVCHASWDDVAWTSLALVERLDHEDVRDLLSEWPWRHNDVIESRSCACGATLTRIASINTNRDRAPINVGVAAPR